jgi:hypothetical protein
VIILRKKEKIRQELRKQQEENIKELEKMGIQFTSLKEHLEHPDKYPFAIGIIPTDKRR